MTNLRRAFVLFGLISTTLTSAHASDGDVDRSYGTAGLSSRAKSADETMPVATAVGHHGSLTVLGLACGDTPDCAPMLARYTAKGTIDRSFGTRGITRIKGFRLRPSLIAVGPDGSVFVAEDATVMKWSPAGRLDATFGARGVRTLNDLGPTEGQVRIHDIAVQSTGKLLVATDGLLPTPGSPAHDVTTFGDVLRLAPDGAVDLTFGNRGFAPAVGQAQDAWRLDVTSDGIAFIGAFYDPITEESGFGIQRLTQDGAPDPRFGRAGFARLPLALDDLLAFDINAAGAPTVVTRTNERLRIARGAPDDGLPGDEQFAVKSHRLSDVRDAVVDDDQNVFALTTSIWDFWYPTVRKYTARGFDKTFGSRGRTTLDGYLSPWWGRSTWTPDGLVVTGVRDHWITSVRLS